MDVSAIDKLRASARDSVRKLSRICEDDDIAEAKKLVEELRNVCAYDEMGQLAEAVSRRDPKDAKNRRLYAQYLINTGKATAAIDLLTHLRESLAKDDPEFAEAMGLIGRATSKSFSTRATKRRRPLRRRWRSPSRPIVFRLRRRRT